MEPCIQALLSLWYHLPSSFCPALALFALLHKEKTKAHDPPTTLLSHLLASLPTMTSPPSVKETTEGVVLRPSALGTQRGLPSWTKATAELVVPRSMPTTSSLSFGGEGRCGGAGGAEGPVGLKLKRRRGEFLGRSLSASPAAAAKQRAYAGRCRPCGPRKPCTGIHAVPIIIC